MRNAFRMRLFTEMPTLALGGGEAKSEPSLSLLNEKFSTSESDILE